MQFLFKYQWDFFFVELQQIILKFIWKQQQQQQQPQQLNPNSQINMVVVVYSLSCV